MFFIQHKQKTLTTLIKSPRKLAHYRIASSEILSGKINRKTPHSEKTPPYLNKLTCPRNFLTPFKVPNQTVQM